LRTCQEPEERQTSSELWRITDFKKTGDGKRQAEIEIERQQALKNGQ
jgi:hypothetical protein